MSSRRPISPPPSTSCAGEPTMGTFPFPKSLALLLKLQAVHKDPDTEALITSISSLDTSLASSARQSAESTNSHRTSLHNLTVGVRRMSATHAERATHTDTVAARLQIALADKHSLEVAAQQAAAAHEMTEAELAETKAVLRSALKENMRLKNELVIVQRRKDYWKRAAYKARGLLMLRARSLAADPKEGGPVVLKPRVVGRRVRFWSIAKRW